MNAAEMQWCHNTDLRKIKMALRGKSVAVKAVQGFVVAPIMSYT